MSRVNTDKEEILFLEEINELINNAKEIENNYFLPKKKNHLETSNLNINKIQSNINNMHNENNNLNYNQKLLERQFRGLKYILGFLEKNYYFISPYHEELKFQNDDEEKMTEEISQKIINLYISKKFSSCYNLWEKYNFKMLLGASPERSFDMLKYLNKIKDRYESRAPILNSLNKLNLDKNVYNCNDKGNQSILHSNANNNSNNISNSQITSSDIYNWKLNENEQFTKKLRKQIDNIKRIQNLNK